MNKTISIIIFVILAVAIVAGGMSFGGGISENQTDSGQQVADGAQNNNSSTINTNMNQSNNGLQIKDIVVGTGAEVKNGEVANVLYTGALDDGTVFDASSKHGNQPFGFTLGAGQVIKGWDLGVLGMKVGGKRELVIPADLGYGARGAAGVIPPNATLHFTVELLSIGQ